MRVLFIFLTWQHLFEWHFVGRVFLDHMFMERKDGLFSLAIDLSF